MFQIRNFTIFLETMEEGDKLKRKNLIKFRIDKNLKSKEMAERLGLTTSYYSNLENGKIINPRTNIANKLEEAFGITNSLELLKLEE